MYLILVAIAAIIIVYQLIVKHYSYWSNRGVKQRRQTYLLGDNARLVFGRESFFDLITNLYNAFPKERYMGTYQMMTPTLVVRDPELIKQIAVKDFDHFVDHRSIIPEDDVYWSRNLFFLKGNRWRDMRTTMSPTFTSSKMKMIFNLVSESAQEFTKYFEELASKGVVSLELKDACTRYTNDVIATVAFGVKCDSLRERENEFYMKGIEATSFTGFRKSIKFAAFLGAPKLCELLKLSLFGKDIGEFFKRVVSEAITLREEKGLIRQDVLHLLLEAKKGRQEHEENEKIDAGFATVEESPDIAPSNKIMKQEIEKGIVRQDVLHMLLEARKGRQKQEENDKIVDAGFAAVEESTDSVPSNKIMKQEITDTDITAQVLIFFFGGFESVSTLMCFMGHELVANLDIQRKLQAEIDETMKECKGFLTYEALLKMKYMDMIVSETLRKWPATPVLDRVCTKPYNIEPIRPNEKPIELKKGDIIFIPISGLHYDPEYFPDPQRFDPERFNDGNKSNIKPYTYLPFGVGPRNCIGSRFALIEAKTMFFHLLSRYNLVATEKTQIPLKLCKKSVNLRGEKGFWVGLKLRAGAN